MKIRIEKPESVTFERDGSVTIVVSDTSLPPSPGIASPGISTWGPDVMPVTYASVDTKGEQLSLYPDLQGTIDCWAPVADERGKQHQRMDG